MDVPQVAFPRPATPRPIVIIGAGGVVRSAHLPAYHDAGFPVLALADPVPGKAAELAGQFAIAHAFDSVTECIRFAPRDAIFDVAVPGSELAKVIALLPDGAAALLQKPMGESLEQARVIRDLCRAKGLTAAVNFQLRYAPNLLQARAMRSQGLLGEVHDMEV